MTDTARRRRFHTLLFRTFTFDFALVLLSIAAVTAFSLFHVRLMLRRNLELRGRTVVATLARDAELPLLLNHRAELEAIAERIAQADDVLAATILPHTGAPVEIGERAEATADEAVVFEQKVRSESASGLLEWGDRGAASEELGSVRVKLSLREQKDFIRRTTVYSLLIGGVIVMLACGLQYRRLREVLKPLNGLVEAAGRVAAGEMAYVERSDSAYEYSRLTEAFNRMVSGLKTTLDQLRESEERYGLAVDGSNDGIWDLDLTTGALYLSPRWKEMLGYGSDELNGGLEAWMQLVHADDREPLERALRAHCQGEVAVFEREYRCYDKSGSVRWMRSRGKAFRPGNGAATRIAGSQTDITAAKAYDPLTRLPNRVLFRERLERAARTGIPPRVPYADPHAEPHAVLSMDVDAFKRINDSLGHRTGDRLLMDVAARLTSMAEAACADGLFARWSLARLGADEFALLLEGLTDSAPEEMAGYVTGWMAQPFTIDHRSLFVTLSVGMAIGTGGEELLRDADTAMGSAKAAGNGQFRLFESHMRQSALERLALDAELRQALERGEFALYYQPKARLSNRRVADFEALIRWRHPTRGLLAPGQFIPFAEECGLIERIGAWVAQEACLQTAAWRRRFPEQKFSISINVSPRQLADECLLEQIRGLLRDNAIPQGFLNVEVTESTVMDNPDRAQGILEELHRLGVGIHVDDFGTGHSSLYCLRRYPFDTLKIDRSFVANADLDAGSAEIIRTIIAMGQSLGLAVVAEGLERSDQAQLMESLGCTFGQGYYFGAPLPAQVAEEVLEKSFAAAPVVEPGRIGPELAALERALAERERRKREGDSRPAA